MISQTSQFKRYDSTSGSEYIFEYMMKTHCAQSTSDVTIQCSDGAVRAHQLVLASISPMLCQELCWNQANEEARTIIMPDLSVSLMSSYLESVYCCEDLLKFEDINRIIGFKFAYSSTNNNDYSIDVTDMLDAEMKQEVDSLDEQSSAENSTLGTRKNITNTDTDGPLPKKQKYAKRSKVWNYFSIDPGDPTQCICRVCEGTIAYHRGTTSNMCWHLRSQHAINVVQRRGQVRPVVSRQKTKVCSKEPVIDPATGVVAHNVQKSYSKKKRRDVWEHFVSFPEDNSKAQCKVCHQIILKGGKAPTTSFTHYLIPHLNQHNIKLEIETCSVCGQTFDSKDKRRKHERTHKEKTDACSHCGKMFRSKQQRENHERIHTGEKPFQCSECDRRFVTKSQLTAHVPVHTGETRYQCDLCGQKFKHLKQKHTHNCIQKYQ